jgi:uncharacterized protein
MTGRSRRERLRERTALYLPSLIRAAEAGDLEAQHDLAAFYATDDLLGLKDEAKAVELYRRAAERGHAESQYDLGFMLLLGEGTGKDTAAGLGWLEQAAANGYAYAARLLSDMHRKGLFGVSANEDTAAFWEGRAEALEREGP